MSDDVVIVSAARTAVGSFNGAFATMPAHDLGAVAIKAALERAGVEPGRVSEVIMGQILTAAQGQNPARQASISAGIPVESPAWATSSSVISGTYAVREISPSSRFNARWTMTGNRNTSVRFRCPVSCANSYALNP